MPHAGARHANGCLGIRIWRGSDRRRQAPTKPGLPTPQTRYSCASDDQSVEFHLADHRVGILLGPVSFDMKLPAHFLGKLVRASTFGCPLPDAGSRPVAYEYLPGRNMEKREAFGVLRD